MTQHLQAISLDQEWTWMWEGRLTPKTIPRTFFLALMRYQRQPILDPLSHLSVTGIAC